jgi:hypothetical protein
MTPGWAVRAIDISRCVVTGSDFPDIRAYLWRAIPEPEFFQSSRVWLSWGRHDSPLATEGGERSGITSRRLPVIVQFWDARLPHLIKRGLLSSSNSQTIASKRSTHAECLGLDFRVLTQRFLKCLKEVFVNKCCRQNAN